VVLFQKNQKLVYSTVQKIQFSLVDVNKHNCQCASAVVNRYASTPASQVDNACCRWSQHASGLTQTFPGISVSKTEAPIAQQVNRPAHELSTYKIADSASAVDIWQVYLLHTNTICIQAKQIIQIQEEWDSPQSTKKLQLLLLTTLSLPPSWSKANSNHSCHSQPYQEFPGPQTNCLPFAPFSPVPKQLAMLGHFKILSHLDSSFPPGQAMPHLGKSSQSVGKSVFFSSACLKFQQSIHLTKLARVREMYSWPYFQCIFGPCVQISWSLFFVWFTKVPYSTHAPSCALYIFDKSRSTTVTF
jgi:hypothetical protein